MNINWTESTGLYRGCRFGCSIDSLEDAYDVARAREERALIIDDGDDDIDDVVSLYTDSHIQPS
jgi:hypothetical protein